ncbi:hypothetical protein ACFWP3_14055 [Streptomyces sp. NPDC058525]|uniref:hypothetical protein n=1 Tax=Streptomyces sp. NPDC058525 TaxID=3346538 RepID=UPI003647D738
MTIDQRSAFAAEIASLAKKYKGAVRAQATTKSGYAVLLTGMWGEDVGAIAITGPDGHEVRRADGWKLGKTAEVAALLWDALEENRSRAAERERLAGLKSVSITSADAIGWAAGKETKQTSGYHLTPEQLAQLRALAAQMAAENAAVTTVE